MAAGVALTLVGELSGKRWPQIAGKPFASLCFIAIALVYGSKNPLMLAAFAFSFIGDVALLSPSMTLGIAAFIGAHVMFCAAFLRHGVDPQRMLIAAPLLALSGVFLARWLLPHTQGDMKPKAIVYLVVVSALVLCGAGVSTRVLAAALIFYISDICVARQRFVHPASINRLIGLPLYYLAQWLFSFDTVI